MSRYLSMVLVLLAILLPATVRAESAPMTEAQFIALAGAPLPGDGVPGEQGRPMEPPKPIEEPPKSKAEDPDGDAGSDDDDAGSGDDGEDAGEEPGDGEDADGEEDGESADAEKGKYADEPTAEETAAFRKALAEEGADIKLEDIPEEARPIVAKKLKDLERGFHAKMRDLSEDQKAARAFRTEERFRREHTVDYLIAMLYEHPELADKVNEKIDELEGNTTALEGHKAIVEKARREAAEAEASEDQKAVSHAKKIEEYVRIGRAAARAAGVPFDAGVEDAMAARLALGEELTESQIRQIAKQKAAVYQRTLRQDKRDKRGKYVEEKLADHRKAGLRVKPGAGRAPTPGAKKVAANDQEFIDEFVARGA